MATYIEREALMAEFDAAVENNGMGYVIGQTLKRYVKRQPAADVVAVVRCKDCKHWDKGELYCHHPAGMTFYGKKCANEGFCYFGERRDEDDI